MSRREYRRILKDLRYTLQFISVGGSTLPCWRSCCRMPLWTLRYWIAKLEDSLILWGPYSEDIDDEDGRGVRTWIHGRWQSPADCFNLETLARHYGADQESGLDTHLHRTGKLFAALLAVLAAREDAQAKRWAAPLPVLMARPLMNRRVRPAKRQKNRRY